MSQADEALSMPASPARGRRAVAVGAAGYSELFVAYMRARDAHVAYCDGPDAPDPAYGTPECEANEAEISRLGDIRCAAREAIQHRPVRSWRDFVELAAVVQGELWQQLPDGGWEKHSIADELEEALQQATFEIIGGGVHA